MIGCGIANRKLSCPNQIVDIITNTIFSSSGTDRILDDARMYFLEISAHYEYSL